MLPRHQQWRPCSHGGNDGRDVTHSPASHSTDFSGLLASNIGITTVYTVHSISKELVAGVGKLDTSSEDGVCSLFLLIESSRRISGSIREKAVRPGRP